MKADQWVATMAEQTAASWAFLKAVPKVSRTVVSTDWTTVEMSRRMWAAMSVDHLVEPLVGKSASLLAETKVGEMACSTAEMLAASMVGTMADL